jgi:hypothetical protein
MRIAIVWGSPDFYERGPVVFGHQQYNATRPRRKSKARVAQKHRLESSFGLAAQN